MDDPQTERRRLAARIENHLRQFGAESSRVIEVFAQRHAMHPTDLQALVIIMNAESQGEPATPGVLRHALNLTSGAVTGAIDRLVRSGHVRRERDPRDRRQVRLHYAESGLALGLEFFGPLAERTDAIMNRLEPEQLEAVEAFMHEIVGAMTAYRQGLQERPSEDSVASRVAAGGTSSGRNRPGEAPRPRPVSGEERSEH